MIETNQKNTNNNTNSNNDDLNWSKDKEKLVLAPFDYLEANPGKDLRSALITAFDCWMKVPHNTLNVITKVVTILHSASLLIDDIEDKATLRRGIPVAHQVFGVPYTLNAANYAYFLALSELNKLKSEKAYEIFTEEILKLHRGQGMDIYWRDFLICPTEEEYLVMVQNKTGGLFRLAVRLMQLESQSDKDFIPLADTLGCLFQIADDYKNLQSTEYESNKGFAEDLTEGKFSFPIIHAIQKEKDNQQLINILRQKTDNIAVKKYAISYMDKETKSFEYTRQKIQAYSQRAKQLIAKLCIGGKENPYIVKLLNKITADVL